MSELGTLTAEPALPILITVGGKKKSSFSVTLSQPTPPTCSSWCGLKSRNGGEHCWIPSCHPHCFRKATDITRWGQQQPFAFRKLNSPDLSSCEELQIHADAKKILPILNHRHFSEMTVKRNSSLLKCRKRTCKNVKCLKLPENNGTWDSRQTENAVLQANSIGRTSLYQFDFLTSIRLLTQNQWSTSKIAVQILWVLWWADKREHINTVQVRISMLFPFTSAQTVPYIQVLLTKIFTC